MRAWVTVLMVVAMTSLLPGSAPRALDPSAWEQYVARFVAADGRVIDTGNGGVSHSEGQGYGMLLAVAFDDRATFKRLWGWTRQHLQIRDDRLFAWRYVPGAEPPVGDRNNAADGDLLIAWALARAAARFEEPAYAGAARAVARDLLELMVRPAGAWTVLLPATQGFVGDDATTVNLSYWLWPAFDELDRLMPSPLWPALAESGLDLLDRARFGRYRLPPDWLDLSATLEPSAKFRPLYGYNAIRIPLHLIWGGRAEAARLAPFLNLAEAFHGAPPATVDLVTGGLDPVPLSLGGRAILELARQAAGGQRQAMPALEPTQDYFSASLLLLATVALHERLER